MVDGDFPNKHGIGIHLVGNGNSITIKITNCFIYGCAAGIVLDAHGLCYNPTGTCDCIAPLTNPCPSRWGMHAPILANNTILADSVAVWGGQLTTDSPPAVGVYVNNHAPLLINNILSGGDSAFEGIRDGCFLLNKVDDLPLAPTMDFNAFDPNFAANGSAPAYTSWANATTGMGIGTGVVPRVDLSARANYFVTDLLAGIGVADHGHDLRLSPYVSDTWSNPPGAMNPLIPNPLIGAGVNLASDRGNPGLSIRNVIGTGFDNHPGLPDGVEEAPLHGWDYDCEGFGNSRLKPRDGPILVTQFGSSDIGADQCGRLIMAGYVPLTRMFAGSVPPSGSTSNDRIFFVDTPNQAGLPRPLNNWVLGGDLWFANVQALPADEPAVPYNGLGLLPKTFYTPGLPNTARWLMYTQGWYGPTPRNLACDFTPTLLSDPKLWWYPMSVILPGVFDIYSINPFYHAFWPLLSNPFPFFLDNLSLFHNRYYSVPHAIGTWSPPSSPINYVLARTWVLDGHLNAPGSLYNPAQDANWLQGASGFFGPWDPTCGAAMYATSQWCLNDACPDPLPPIAIDLGIRINCEIPRSLSPLQTNTNLQTFLVIPNGGGTQAMSSPAPSMAREATRQAISSARAVGLSMASLLNIPAYLGSELEYRSYVGAVRALTGSGQ